MSLFLLFLSFGALASATVAPTPATNQWCPGLNITQLYLDYGTVDMVRKGTPDRLGDFDFCLPETRVLLRHSVLPVLTSSHSWELFIRSPSFALIGTFTLTLDDTWYRARCVNGSYTRFQDGETLQPLNWTLMDIGGAETTYTDKHHPSHRLLYGFYCKRVDSRPRHSLLQGVCLRRFCCIWDIGMAEYWDGKAYLEGWHHSTPDTINTWDNTGPQRCGGPASSLSLLHRQDPLHPVGTAPRQRGELLVSNTLSNKDLLSTWHSNSYVRLVAKVAEQAKMDNCWVCANTPAHIQSGIPFLGVPLTLQQYLSANVAAWNLTAVNLTHQYIYLTGPTSGDLCRKFVGDERMIGDSTCKYSIAISLSGRVTLWHDNVPKPQADLLSAWKVVMNLPDSWVPTPTSKCFFQTFATGHIGTCLQGLFWLCGHRGYVWASPHSRGNCYLGLILPGIRVTPELPVGRRRNKRDKTLSDHSQAEANGETYGRALFPPYGAGANHVDILKLTDILLTFMEESNAATQSVLAELSEVRQVALQNKLALDYVLASTGGVCALIGAECCTFVSDQTLNITGHLNNIHALANDLRDIQHEGLSDASLWSWLPGTGWLKHLVGNIIVVICAVVLCIAIFCCAMHCFPLCCQTCRACFPRQTIPTQQNRAVGLHYDHSEYVEMRPIAALRNKEFAL